MTATASMEGPWQITDPADLPFINNGLYGNSQQWAYTSGWDGGSFVFTWAEPQTIANCLIYTYTNYSDDWSIEVFYKSSSSDLEWQPITATWNKSLWGSSNTDILFSGAFPAVTAAAIKIHVVCPVYPFYAFSEIAFYNEPPVSDVAAIKIKNLSTQDGEDPFADQTAVSYRHGKTIFQAIGYDMNNNEIGPVSVRWELEGGSVNIQEQLKVGILAQLGCVDYSKIGHLSAGIATSPTAFPVASATTVVFNSYIPGNIRLTASKDGLTDFVDIRVKQPHFKVNVYPVGDVDTTIFDTWKDIALQIWEKENIIKVDSIDLMPAIANVSYPNAPFGQPMRGAESFLSSELYVELDLTHPLCMTAYWATLQVFSMCRDKRVC